MKTTTLSVLLALALLLSACAAMRRMEAEGTDDLLVAAGFTIKSADTPEQLAKLKAMKPLKIVRRVKDGQMLYTYADPYDCQCLFIGTPQQYQEYTTRLALQKQIADEQMQAAEAEEAAAMDMEWWWW